MKDAVLKGLAELARVAVLAVIPVLIVSLESGAINYELLAVTASIAVLRALDKMLHKYGETIENKTLAKGLTRF